MKTIQLSEDKYVTYHIEDGTTIIGKAYIGEKYLGHIRFNMKCEIPESDLETFTIKEANALYDSVYSEFSSQYN